MKPELLLGGSLALAAGSVFYYLWTSPKKELVEVQQPEEEPEFESDDVPISKLSEKQKKFLFDLRFEFFMECTSQLKKLKESTIESFTEKDEYTQTIVNLFESKDWVKEFDDGFVFMIESLRGRPLDNLEKEVVDALALLGETLSKLPPIIQIPREYLISIVEHSLERSAEFYQSTSRMSQAVNTLKNLSKVSELMHPQGDEIEVFNRMHKFAITYWLQLVTGKLTKSQSAQQWADANISLGTSYASIHLDMYSDSMENNLNSAVKRFEYLQRSIKYTLLATQVLTKHMYPRDYATVISLVGKHYLQLACLLRSFPAACKNNGITSSFCIEECIKYCEDSLEILESGSSALPMSKARIAHQLHNTLLIAYSIRQKESKEVNEAKAEWHIQRASQLMRHIT